MVRYHAPRGASHGGAKGVYKAATSWLRWSRKHSKRPATHGTAMRRFGVKQGPVEFRLPKDLTQAERRQAQEYIDAANSARRNGDLSPTGRVKVDGDLKRDKERAAERERQRAEDAGTPYGSDVAAHLPDTTWVGQPDPPGWGSHTSRVNSILGSQSGRYPEGYRPTVFGIADS
jgi:hypothetical protein